MYDNIETTNEDNAQIFHSDKPDELFPQQKRQQQQQQPSFSIETALDWWQRSQTKLKNVVPTDPVTCAQAILQGECPTGIRFLDEALQDVQKKTLSHLDIPIVELLEKISNNFLDTVKRESIDSRSCSAGTWTLISLAARFVVATRPSRFPMYRSHHSQCSPHSLSKTFQSDQFYLPKVILVDPFLSISISDLVSTVRAILLLQWEDKVLSSTLGYETVEEPCPLSIDAVLEECLSRIHFIFPTDTLSTMASLEALHCFLVKSTSLRSQQQFNMLFWDNFLGTIPQSNGKQEVIRQLLRLWRETNLMVVVVTKNSYSEFDDSNVTCRIRLEQNEHAKSVSDDDDDDDNKTREERLNNHSHKATLLGAKNKLVVPFTIGASGILS